MSKAALPNGLKITVERSALGGSYRARIFDKQGRVLGICEAPTREAALAVARDLALELAARGLP